MQPGGEGGVAAKGSDFAIELEKGLLCEVLSFSDVAEHAEAKRIDTPLLQRVQHFERCGIAGLCCSNGLGLSRNRGIAPHMMVHRFLLGFGCGPSQLPFYSCNTLTFIVFCACS